MPLDLYINVTHSIFYFLAAVYSPHVRDQVKKFPSSQFPFHPTTSYNLNTQLNIAFNEIDSLLFLFVVSQILQFSKFSCFFVVVTFPCSQEKEEKKRKWTNGCHELHERAAQHLDREE